MTSRRLASSRYLIYVAVALALVAVAVTPRSDLRAQQAAAPTVTVDNDDLGGVVTGPKGPEAGVWVIAETAGSADEVREDRRHRRSGPLPAAGPAEGRTTTCGFAVTGSSIHGRFRRHRGKNLNLTAIVAPSAVAAAQYYPAGYWFSMMQVPDAKEFPGTGPEGNGISPNIRTQAEWIQRTKSGGCMACHQLGSKGIREIPEALGRFPNSIAAWDRRVQSGQAGAGMSARPRSDGPAAPR